jgi:hypothetical protein
MKPSSFDRAKRLIEVRPPEEIVHESIRRLLKPIGEHEFADQGVLTWETPEHHVVCSYESNIDDRERRLIEANATTRGWETGGVTWRKLRTITWEVFGLRFDIKTLIPEGISVFFGAGAREGHAADYVPKDRAIYVLGDFCSPAQLLVLLHEVGHVTDWARRYGSEEMSYPEQEMLELERSANAFALNALRPSFIANEAWKTDVVNFLKYGSLHNYSKTLVEKHNAGNLHMHRGDWDEYMYNNEFDE